MAQTTKEALRKANEVYDTALTLLTDVNGLTAPDIDIVKLKREALEANDQVLGYQIHSNESKIVVILG